MCSTLSLRSFPKHCIWNSFDIGLIDDGPLSFQWRSLSVSSFFAATALCPQVVSQAPQNFRSSEMQDTFDGCFARQSMVASLASLSVRSFPMTPEWPGQYIHWNFRRWTSNTDTRPDSHSEHCFLAPSSKLCHNIWLRHWRGTLYLRAAVQRRGQRPPKGSGTNMTVKAT